MREISFTVIYYTHARLTRHRHVSGSKIKSLQLSLMHWTVCRRPKQATAVNFFGTIFVLVNFDNRLYLAIRETVVNRW
jgi:hypothetical protein